MDPRLLMSRMTERGEGEDSHLMQFHVVGFTSRYTSFL